MKLAKCIGLITIIMLLNACVHHRHHAVIPQYEHEVDRVLINYYATVIQVGKVYLDSDVPENAAAGALWSIVHSSARNKNEVLFAGLIGAVFYGVATAISEGPRVVYRNELVDVDNYQLTIVTRHNIAREGDCVLVTEGEYSTFKVVNQSFCDD